MRDGGDPVGSLCVKLVLALERIVLGLLVDVALVRLALSAVNLRLGENAIDGLTTDLLELTGATLGCLTLTSCLSLLSGLCLSLSRRLTLTCV